MAAVEFHPLTVAEVEHLTDDSVRLTFAVPDDVQAAFRHVPGQHLTLRAVIDGEDVRRSYSICSPSDVGRLQVGVKRLPGGTFSTWANEVVQPGTVVEATPPTGDFTHEPAHGNAATYVAVAAGSGITPVLSIISSTLRDEPHSEFVLVFGNRSSSSVMFLDDLDDLKGRYPDRLMVLHILSREAHDLPLLTGRIDGSKIRELCDAFIPPAEVDGWYLCGPRGMVTAVSDELVDLGVPPTSIHDELFYAGDGPIAVATDDAEGSEVRFTLDGRTSIVRVDPDGAPILDHVLSIRPEGPFSCRSGACASCRAHVTAGEVRMDRNWSLNDEEVASGQILTCQSHPVSPIVELTYDR